MTPCCAGPFAFSDWLWTSPYIPVHTQPYDQAMGFAEGNYPEAERYYREAISLPLFPGLAEAEQDFVVEQLRAILER